MLTDAGLFGNIFKLSVTEVAIQGRRQWLEIFRMAVDPNVFVAIAAEAILQRRARVMNNKQVEFAVVIVIKPAGGDCPLPAFNSRLCSDIFERAVAAIAVERVS